MNIDLHALTPQQYSLLVEQAKRDALRLRRDAIAGFWAAVARAARGGLQALRRRSTMRRARAGRLSACAR